jgi:phage-related protein
MADAIGLFVFPCLLWIFTAPGTLTMAADFDVSFDGYTYADVTGLTVRRLDDGMAVRSRMATPINHQGQFTAGGLLDARKFSLSGLLKGTSADDLRQKWDAFRQAHRPRSPSKFYLHSDRYRWAEVAGIGKVEMGETAKAWLEWSVEFVAADPYDYAETATSTTGLSGGGTVTTAGDSTSLPIFTMVVSSIGTDGTITIGNSTTGESFVLAPCATGTVTIDSRLQTVVRSSVDVTHEMNGQFLTLAPGANTITVSTSGGASISSLSSSAADRWA